MTAHRRRRLGLAAVGALSLLGCERAASAGLTPCQVYRPHLAKRTFDGRVGAVLLRNTGAREVEVRVYHPDGAGDVELTRRVAPGSVLVLQGEEGVRLALGNDWGIQVDGSCTVTLGESAAWAPGEFSLHWDGDSLRAGLRDGR